MISYIIATYAGINHTSNKELSHIVLSRVFDRLIELLRNKKDQSLPNLINEVLVMVPPVKKGDRELPFYYMPDTWTQQLESYGVSLRFINYTGENKHWSYDQWIMGWLQADPSSEYLLFAEDDYYLDPSSGVADLQFVDHYNKRFPDGVGFLTTYAGEMFGYGYHAVISNGMISRKTLLKMDDPLAAFYKNMKSDFCQVMFSELFEYYSVPMRDYSDAYTALYWSAYRNQLEQYGETHSEFLFLPVQYLYLNHNQSIIKM